MPPTPRHTPLAGPALLALLEAGTLADVALAAGEGDSESDGPLLPAHRVILAAGSGYFATVFTGAFAAAAAGGGGSPHQAAAPAPSIPSSSSSPLPVARVPGVPPAALAAVVRAIYAGDARAAGVPVVDGGEEEESSEGEGPSGPRGRPGTRRARPPFRPPSPPPTPVSVTAVLAAADYLAVPWLAAACLDAVRAALGPATCLPALGLASTYGGEGGGAADGGALFAAALALAEARFGDLLAAALGSVGGGGGGGGKIGRASCRERV